MKVALVVKPEHPDSGVGRYAAMLGDALRREGVQVYLVYPIVPLPGWFVRLVRQVLGWDMHAFFMNYPLWASYPKADLYHLTSQNLATLMLFHPPPGKTVITVHDIIPHQVRGDAELRVYKHFLDQWFDRLALYGLRRAVSLISVSTHSRDMLVKYLALHPNNVFVVPEGVHTAS